MKGFLSGHWEKLVLAVAGLLCAASATFNLLLASAPAGVAEVADDVGKLNGLLDQPSTAVLPAPRHSQDLQARLAFAPGEFTVPRGLIAYDPGDSHPESFSLVEGASRTIPSKDRFDDVVVSNPVVAEVLPQGGDKKTGYTEVKVTARKPGETRVDLKLHAKHQGTLTITVTAKDRIELWPPVLLGVRPSATDPGEVTVTWKDDDRTAAGITLGYVIERRARKGAQWEPFAPVLGEGRMLKPSTRSYVDIVQPNRQYEYRVLAIGNHTVTHIREDAP